VLGMFGNAFGNRGAVQAAQRGQVGQGQAGQAPAAAVTGGGGEEGSEAAEANDEAEEAAAGTTAVTEETPEQEQSLQGQSPQSCWKAAATCNSNILCGTALRKQLPLCQNPIFPKRCFKCQVATNVLRSTPEGAAYMNCECGLDLICRARRRLQSGCLASSGH
jgi:hypothetical protein